MPAIVKPVTVTVSTRISQAITCIFPHGVLNHKSLKICTLVRAGYLKLLYLGAHAKSLHMKISHLCRIEMCILQGKARQNNIETNMSSILRVCTSSLHLRLFSLKKQEDSTRSASAKLLQMACQMQKKNL